MKRLYRPDEAAAILQVTRRTIYNYIREGRLTAVKISARSIRIPAEELMKLLKVHTNKPS